MVRSSGFAAWFISAACIATFAGGCQTASRNAVTSAIPRNTPAAADKQAPEPAEFMFGTELKDPVKVHLAYALWHEQEGKLDEARNSYDTVLKESPKNVDALLGLARLDIALGRMDDAGKRLEKAHKVAPKNSKVAVSFGQYYSARGDWPKALKHMQEARELAPYDAACAYHLGYVQAKTGDMTAALASFTEAVGAAEAQYNLAFILQEQGNLVAAEEHLQHAISLKPDLAQAQSLLITVRQQRNGGLMNTAQASPTPSNRVQPAGYTEPAPQVRSAFDPVPGQR